MESLLEAVRAATASGATTEQKAAGVQACRTILAALDTEPGKPLVPPTPTAPLSRLGHKRIEETMRYVHVAADHAREVPDVILQLGLGETDPDRRIITMLGARVRVVSVASIVRDENEAVTTA